MKLKILLAIPCYNCEKQIVRVISDLTPDLLNLFNQVIIIDNQSRDQTLSVAKKILIAKKANIILLQNQHNYGLGGSHKVAFNYAFKHGFTHVLILHGDHQAKTEEVALLINTLVNQPKLFAVLGARFMAKSTLIGYSPTRIWGNRVLNFIYTLLTGRETQDLGSGINLLSLKTFPQNAYLSFANNLTFNLDLLLYLYSARKDLVFVPITWSETDQVSNARNFKIGWAALTKLISWRLNLFPTPPVPQAYVSAVIYPQGNE